MEDSTEWKLLKMCSDKMDLTITSSVTYSKNDHIVIDGLLIAATEGVNLFDTIDATAKKAIGKVESYSQQHQHQMVGRFDFDLNEKYQRFFPLFETYIVDFKNRVASTTQGINADASVPTNGSNWNSETYNPTNWSWNAETYNPNYYVTKNYTTATSNGVTVKVEPREVRVVKRKMLHDRHHQIDKSNIGFKMLLGLGWSGGPLGANQDGISEPISVELRARRSGLGCADRQSNKSTYGNINNHIFFQFLKEYADDDRQYEDLEFSDDFSNKEKKKLYGISKDLNLHHESEHRNGMLVVKIMKPTYNYNYK